MRKKYLVAFVEDSCYCEIVNIAMGFNCCCK